MSFVDIIDTLYEYWSKMGCVSVYPTDIPMGAATMHPHFILNAKKSHKLAYFQPCRRPQDSSIKSQNRLYKHHQFQVTINPAPDNAQEIFLNSLQALGFNFDIHEIKFIAGEWKSPSLGAFGEGSEVWANNSEISQFTYFQQIGGKNLKNQLLEITYGLERIAMLLQKVDNWRNIIWKNEHIQDASDLCQSKTNQESSSIKHKQFSNFSKYMDMGDEEFSHASSEIYNIDHLKSHFELYSCEAKHLIKHNLQKPAYEAFLYASHFFNTLESRQAFSNTERVEKLNHLREIGQQCINMNNHDNSDFNIHNKNNENNAINHSTNNAKDKS